ncbi:DNA-binding protein, YbaB/EbfC family [Mycoplasmopsis arginini]|uniref:YbaB/EbfC family nucleoid-associated protein n=1 Tax=Mycoplasmopsis arginini TaxID=2094 RepID=UPI000A27EF54|nr:DNA-binding protein, YbaB/EbfC family [Chlamydia abortus]SGA08228.1 DNA-binding protein, YbaB/EbfC family [Mycoplasmopsis arginini]SGA08374.1 DNA-binding protein, YbaB/EbfC family [Mycoplasmopsis arginini]SGA30446.1 DNA-binding protein, YbaB/EbfC family [Mycoplasmopsis arginini]SGA31922.1 DNA-binding protein, YbaB/EbfC family [Chlamydia abortus]
MNINEMLKNAKRIQSEMEKDEQVVAKQSFVVEKQGIKVTMNGQRKITEIIINEALIDPEDPELIQDLIMLAVNEALEKIEAAYDEIGKKYSNNGLPF